MPRVLVASAILSAAFAVGGTAAPQPPAAGPVLFFPTTPKSKWVYQSGKAEWAEEITAVAQSGDGVVVTTRLKTRSGDGSERAVLASAGGVFTGPLDRPDGPASNTFPTPLLRLPARPGDVWKYEGGGYKWTHFVGPPEDVRVPAGLFRVVPVASEGEAAGKPVRRITDWWAPGVGVVKREVSEGRSTSKLVLKAFAPGPVASSRPLVYEPMVRMTNRGPSWWTYLIPTLDFESPDPAPIGHGAGHPVHVPPEHTGEIPHGGLEGAGQDRHRFDVPPPTHPATGPGHGGTESGKAGGHGGPIEPVQK